MEAHKGLPPIAEPAATIRIQDAQEALELLVNYKYQGYDHLIVSAHHLHPDFFDLKTGLAGDMLQKFSNYDGFLGIIVDHTIYGSQSLNDFVKESNRAKRIVFAESKELIIRHWWPQPKR